MPSLNDGGRVKCDSDQHKISIKWKSDIVCAAEQNQFWQMIPRVQIFFTTIMRCVSWVGPGMCLDRTVIVIVWWYHGPGPCQVSGAAHIMHTLMTNDIGPVQTTPLSKALSWRGDWFGSLHLLISTVICDFINVVMLFIIVTAPCGWQWR